MRTGSWTIRISKKWAALTAAVLLGAALAAPAAVYASDRTARAGAFTASAAASAFSDGELSSVSVRSEPGVATMSNVIRHPTARFERYAWVEVDAPGPGYVFVSVSGSLTCRGGTFGGILVASPAQVGPQILVGFDAATFDAEVFHGQHLFAVDAAGAERYEFWGGHTSGDCASGFVSDMTALWLPRAD